MQTLDLIDEPSRSGNVQCSMINVRLRRAGRGRAGRLLGGIFFDVTHLISTFSPQIYGILWA
jgi:hypothetical protein